MSVSCRRESSLGVKLHHRIRRHGPLTFAAFMEAALYDSEGGYYASERLPWGARGDYLTAPQVHPAFGEAVARLAAEVDRALAGPEPFTLVEVGSGDGTLLGDVGDALLRHHPDLYARLRLVSVERSPTLRRIQRQRLGRHRGRLRWAGSLGELPPDSMVGGFVANELVDALPVHRVVGRGGALQEIYVDLEEGRFVERLGPPSTPDLAVYLEDNGLRLREGQLAEISLAAGRWLAAASRRLRRGFLLTVDYGADSEELFGPDNPEGTLVCQRRFRLSRDPYRHVGEQDITVQVDFGNLRRAGRESGLVYLGECSLGAFLVGFGAGEDAGLRPGDPQGGRRHLALRHLLFSEVAVAHRALLQGRDLTPGQVPFGRRRLDGQLRLPPPSRDELP